MKKNRIIAALSALIMLPMSGMTAHAESHPFVHGKDNWYFGNTPLLIGNFYRLTPHDRAIMEQTLSHTERRIFDECMAQKWQGCCYGFAVTSILCAAGIFDPKTYELDASDLYSLHITEDTISLLNYYQPMQCMDETRREIMWTQYYQTSDERLQELLTLAKDGKPALVCYQGHFRRMQDIFGHAVAAYGYETGDYTYYGKHYDAMVLLYDSNAPYDTENCNLYVNTQEGNWCIPTYELYSEEGAEIGMVSADLELLNNRGLIAGTEYKSDKPLLAMLSSAKMTGTYSCTKTSFDGSWHDTQEQADIKEFRYCSGSSTAASDIDFIMPDADSGYHLHVEEEQPLDLTMCYDGMLLLAEGTAQDVRFSPDGTVMTASTGQPYRFEYVGNEGKYYGSFYDVTIAGNAATAQLSMTEDGYLLTADILDAVQITAKNDTGREMLNVAPDTNSVLFYETDTHHLAAAIDKDGNGSCETVIAKASQLGDLNADGTANSSDAAQLLIAAASIGAGNASGLTETQETAADVNADGSINASDAALILQYAAAIGAGSFDGNLELYVCEVLKE